MDRGDRHRRTALAVHQPTAAGRPGHLFQGELAGGVLLEHPGDHRRQNRVGYNDALAGGAVHVGISQRRERRPHALHRLLAHPLDRLFPQVVGVVLRHQHLDSVHELLRGPGVGRKHDVLLDEVEFQPEFVDRHPILYVPVEAVGLLHQHDPAGCILGEERDHLAESRAAGLLGSLHIRELLQHGDAVRRRIGPEQFQLRRD